MREGFTLVEVLVAVAIASLLILGVSSSTQATIRMAERQQAGARAEEERTRAIELLRQDWRGRVRSVRPLLPGLPAPGGLRKLVLTSTGDSITTSAGRGSFLVTYTASEKGLSRKEGGEEIVLFPEPVGLEFWDGVVWRSEPAVKILAL
ncbi:MAG TPA: type II secretion system protein, partial [Planctomycetota bacterium]|nr:type II secretion system protein [Planctomycetota bacterium]